MKNKLAVGLCMALAMVLFSQTAMARTRVFLNFGFPVILGYHEPAPVYVVHEYPPSPPPERVIIHEYMPGPYRIWVNGYRYWDGYGYVWVPGHWKTVYPRHEMPQYKERDRGRQEDRDWDNDRDRWEDRD